MSIVLGNPMALSGKKKSKGLDFTYTGDYTEREDGVVELRSSGAITFNTDAVIDVFMVGGGSSGAYQISNSANAYTGGSGGYTRTIKRVAVNKNTPIPANIGTGGLNGANGGDTSFNSIVVKGGVAPTEKSSGTGGSGGGAGGWLSRGGGGAGGTDGSGGLKGDTSGGHEAGTGQGFTTREFGEATGKLYSGGGGGATYIASASPKRGGAGGDGGGGRGAGCGERGDYSIAGTAGVANTGGGGGAGGRSTNQISWVSAGAGGSGIVCFRDAQELPELAGTWVLNERLYASPTGESINETVNYTAVTPSGNFNGVKVSVGYSSTSTAGFYLNQSTTFALYQFSNNRWSDSTRAISQITFPTGATASDEFRAWLASNATKQ